jgi:menaquinone-specific isochorismate synthase
MRARLTPTVCAERLPGQLAYREALDALRQRLQDLCRSSPAQRRGLLRVEARVDNSTIPSGSAASDASAMTWLASLPVGRRMLFRSRDGQQELAGVGWALSTHDWRHPALTGIVTACESRSESADPDAHGPLDPAVLVLEPFRDDQPMGQEWRDFETTRLILPAVEWRAVPGGAVLAVNGVGAASPTLETISELSRAFSSGSLERASDAHAAGSAFRTHEGPSTAAPVWRMCDDGDPARWADAIDAALSAIAAGRMEKVVLARTRRYACDALIDPVHVLSLLRREEPAAYHLLVECGAGRAFVAASPERLFGRVGRTVHSEAVAGTCARGPDESSDVRLADRLLSSDKNRREHDIVTRCIESALRPLTAGLSAAASPRIVRCAHVQHLSTPISGELREGVDDGTVLGRLHPTPAVCGLPVGEARSFIAAHEPRPRGMYAGAVGMVTARSSDFAVGIRSALIDGDMLTAFAGAGIVAGSEADSEWLETERKLESFGAVLRPRAGMAPASSRPQGDAVRARRPVAAANRAV